MPDSPQLANENLEDIDHIPFPGDLSQTVELIHRLVVEAIEQEFISDPHFAWEVKTLPDPIKEALEASIKAELEYTSQGRNLDGTTGHMDKTQFEYELPDGEWATGRIISYDLSGETLSFEVGVGKSKEGDWSTFESQIPADDVHTPETDAHERCEVSGGCRSCKDTTEPTTPNGTTTPNGNTLADNHLSTAGQGV